MGKVLIVDEQDVMRELYHKLFDAAGFTVRQASNIYKALSILVNDQFDIILINTKMSEGERQLVLNVVEACEGDVKIMFGNSSEEAVSNNTQIHTDFLKAELILNK